MMIKERLGLGYSLPKAIDAFFTLMSNPEDTKSVTLFRDAVNPNWYDKAYMRFKYEPNGRRILDEKLSLYDRLTDLAYLKALPEGSVGKLYYEFTAENGLSPDGFRDTYHAVGHDLAMLGEDRARAHYRIIDIHDILHILTGYGRDAFGEICILAFQGVQFRDRGLAWLAYSAGVKVKVLYPREPVFPYLQEARKIAAEAMDLATADWEKLLEATLDEARVRLSLRPAQLYIDHHEIWVERDNDFRRQLESLSLQNDGDVGDDWVQADAKTSTK